MKVSCQSQVWVTGDLDYKNALRGHTTSLLVVSEYLTHSPVNYIGKKLGQNVFNVSKFRISKSIS